MSHAKQLFNTTINGARVVIAKDGDSYSGAVFYERGEPTRMTHSNFEQLKHSLLNEADKLHPDYFGFDGAKARFLSFFPDGFADKAYCEWERRYKDDVVCLLGQHLPVEKALAASADDAIFARKAFGKNLLSSYENARIHQVLGSQTGADFIRAAAAFANSECGDELALAKMAKAIEPAGRPSWPLVTYLPYLFRPETHMFLKPEATNDFAARTGAAFQHEYSSDLEIGVYQSLLALASATRNSLGDLNPRDGIDTQSFIWVVGSYKESDREEIQDWKANQSS